MHLTSDYIHPHKDAGGRAHCRVRIYVPDNLRDSPVVIGSGLANNPAGSIANSAEVIAAGVTRADELPTPLAWIEHWPRESTDGGAKTFDTVVLYRHGRFVEERPVQYQERFGPLFDCGSFGVRPHRFLSSLPS